MNLKRILAPEAVWVDLRADSKEAVIEELVDRLIAAGKLRAESRDEVLSAIWKREKKMSTGLQNGVAVPHGRTDAVEELTTAVGIHKQGVDFQSLDGEPSRIFILTLSPPDRPGPHMQFLAEVARLVSRPEERARLLNARTHHEVYEIITGKPHG